MTRLSVLALFAGAAVSFPAARAEDPPKSDSDTKPASDVIVTKFNAGDVTGTVAKVSGSQITIKVPQQVPNGVTTRSVRVPNPHRPGHAQTYHTVRQKIPKYKTVQTDVTFDLSGEVAVKTASGRATDMSMVQTGSPVVVHLMKVKEGRSNEKAEIHLEVTRILVPNTAAPPKKN
jgi:hypothetical protein